MPLGPQEMDPGTVIAERYRLVRKLGEGGMGAVYEAEHVVVGRRIALKILQKREDLPPETWSRFMREARAPATVRHPNVVEVLDAGLSDGNTAFIAMELLDGEGLDELLRAERVIQPQRLAGIMEQLLAALAAMHARGIIHRDLKPANIFLARDEGGAMRVKVLDFGIAKALDEDVRTRTGYVMGTPAYMAPEQMRSARQATARSDLWSVGVILYEALVGYRPFRGPTFGLIAQITGPDPARALPELNPKIPAELAEVVASLLHKDAAQRPGDATTVREQLVPALLRCPPVSALAPPDEEPAPPSDPGGMDHTDPAHPSSDPSADPVPLVPSGASAKASASGPVLAVSSSPPAGARVSIQSAPQRPLGLVLGGVTVGGLATAVLAWSLVRHTPEGPTPQPPPPSTQTDGGRRSNAPQTLRELPAAQTFLQRWYAAVTNPRARNTLGLYYAPSVRFRAPRGQSDAAAIQRYWTGFFVDGATFALDWDRSTWQEEPATLDAVPASCVNVPGASGPVLKVRGWALEDSNHHPEDIGCSHLEGVYLLRLRRVGGTFAVCHESWSIQDGICASCPTARLCGSDAGG